jgi:hypothetical protein
VKAIQHQAISYLQAIVIQTGQELLGRRLCADAIDFEEFLVVQAGRRLNRRTYHGTSENGAVSLLNLPGNVIFRLPGPIGVEFGIHLGLQYFVNQSSYDAIALHTSLIES